MWVVQEVGVAENVHLQIGDYALQWDSFMKVAHYLYYVRNHRLDNINKVTGLEKIRMGWNYGKRQPLRELLWDTRYRRATDPRDNIYSLLGLMGDPMSNLLQPDYSKSVSEVYANSTLYLITQNSSLDIICGQQIHGRRQDLPSWVPDYTLNRSLAASPLVRIDGRESIYGAPGYGVHSKCSVPTIPTQFNTWKILHARGICIDTIAHISSPAYEDETFGAIQERWYSTLVAVKESLDGFTEDVGSYLTDISSLIS